MGRGDDKFATEANRPSLFCFLVVLNLFIDKTDRSNPSLVFCCLSARSSGECALGAVVHHVLLRFTTCPAAQAGRGSWETHVASLTSSRRAVAADAVYSFAACARFALDRKRGGERLEWPFLLNIPDPRCLEDRMVALSGSQRS